MVRTTSWGWRATSCTCPHTAMPTSPRCWVLSCTLCWPRDHTAYTPPAKGLTCPSASSATFLSGSMTFSSVRCWVLSLSQGRWEHQKLKARISEVSISICLTWWNNWEKLYFKTLLFIVLSLLNCIYAALQTEVNLCVKSNVQEKWWINRNRKLSPDRAFLEEFQCFPDVFVCCLLCKVSHEVM